MHKITKVSPQARELYVYLLANRLVTTIQCRDELSIMSPSARISELKAHGLPIENIYYHYIDAKRRKHRIARYYLRVERMSPEQWRI